MSTEDKKDSTADLQKQLEEEMRRMQTEATEKTTNQPESSHHHPHSGKKRKHSNKKKLPVWAKILIAALCVIVLAIGGIYVYAQLTLNKIHKVDPTEITKVDPAEETFDVDPETTPNPELPVVDEATVQWPEADTNIMQDGDVVNILLVGQDKRSGEERQRSDTNIVLTINKAQNTIKVTSIMRDLYVQIPGYSDNRINAAYQFGGFSLLDQTIETNLSLHIDANVEVDFDGFTQMIDAIDGVDIELNDTEVLYFNSNMGHSYTAGINHMSGAEALEYARCRSVGNSDWRRTERQRTVIMAVFDKLKGESLSTLMGLADTILPLITTDMSNNQILGYVYTVATMGASEMESYRLPVEGTYSNVTLSKGMEVLMPDLGQNRMYLKQYIYGE
ncbi:MAG: LCP family protein [Lachnospiraceae bacterium]|nr:LCP family protein [Lachnospiraceae bacterium]